MATKIFCDWCNKEIASFSKSKVQLSNGGYGLEKYSFLDSDVCSSCVSALIALKKERKDAK